MVPPACIPDEAQIVLNAPVLWFTLAVSVGAAILFGLLPAVQASGGDLASPLKEAGRGLSSGKRQLLLRGGLVVGEVAALSVILLVGASLMIRTLLAMKGGDLGARPDRTLTLRIPFSNDRYPDANRRVAFFRKCFARVETVPGVVAVGINTGLPPIGNWNAAVEIAGATQKDGRPVLVQQVNDKYAAAMGVSVDRGRFFTEQEVFGRIHSAVVNEAFVTLFFGGEAIGHVVKLPRLSAAPVNLADSSFQIVGITKNTTNRIATQDTIPEIFIPYTLAGLADRVYILSSVRPESLAKGVREQVYAVDRSQPVTEEKTLEIMLGDYVYARPRFNLFLFTLFACLGLILALSGVYGVISNTVAQRTREIGIRLALGASLTQIVGMVLSGGARLIALGVVVGLIGSLASVRLLAGLVRNISTFDQTGWIRLQRFGS